MVLIHINVVLHKEKKFSHSAVRKAPTKAVVFSLAGGGSWGSKVEIAKSLHPPVFLPRTYIEFIKIHF